MNDCLNCTKRKRYWGLKLFCPNFWECFIENIKEQWNKKEEK